MATVTNSTSTSSAIAAATSSSTANLSSEIQDRFLTLLITQLKNQDPLNPMENAEVTSQLAQLSTVNGITQLNQTLQAVSGQIDLSQSLQATSLVGRDVLVPGEKISVADGASTPFGVDVITAATDVTVSIVDAAGNVVRKYDLGTLGIGVYGVEWDGLNTSGATAADGVYRAVVSGTDSSGAPVSVGTLTYGHVDSVAYAADGLKLDLGLAGTVSLFDIRKVL